MTFFLLCGYETDLLSEQLSSSSAVVWYEPKSYKCIRDRQINVQEMHLESVAGSQMIHQHYFGF